MRDSRDLHHLWTPIWQVPRLLACFASQVFHSLLRLRLRPVSKPRTLTYFSPQSATGRPQHMTSRSVAGGHTLPPNPEFLDFERTDGDPKKWPTNTKQVVDTDGNVNYMKPLGPDDSSDIHWRCQIATKVAERLGKPCTWPVCR